MMTGARAAYDIGSNSVKLVLASPETGLDAPFLEEIRICGLGRELAETGRLSDAAMARTLDAMVELSAMAERRGAVESVAVGTMAMRSAANAGEFIGRVRELCGFEIQVIPGEEEARLSYLAATSSLGVSAEPRMLFDIGGGSTEFILGRGELIERRFSLDVGCIRLTEDHQKSDPPTPGELASMRSALEAELADLPAGEGELVGIGGTVSSLGTVHLEMDTWEPGRIQGLTLDQDEVERQVELFRRLPLAERAALPGLHPDRAPVILAGAAIVLTVMRLRGGRILTLSDRALRHGLWLDRWGG